MNEKQKGKVATNMKPKSKSQRILEFKGEELETLQRDPRSRVLVERSVRHIALPPSGLKHFNSSIKRTLDRLLRIYDPMFDGFLLGYRNVECHSDKGVVMNDECHVHFNIKADFFIFMPKVGCELQGIVNKISSGHIGCLVHKFFNVTIPRPKSESTEEWMEDNVKIGYKVTFILKTCDYTGNIPYLQGKLTSWSPSESTNTQQEEEEEGELSDVAVEDVFSKKLEKRSQQTKRKLDPSDSGGNKKKKKRKDEVDGESETPSFHLTSEDPEFGHALEHIKDCYLSKEANGSSATNVEVKAKKNKKRKLYNISDDTIEVHRSADVNNINESDSTEKVENKKKKQKKKHTSDTEDKKDMEGKLNIDVPDIKTLLERYKTKAETLKEQFFASLPDKHGSPLDNSPESKNKKTELSTISSNINLPNTVQGIEPIKKKNKKKGHRESHDSESSFHEENEEPVKKKKKKKDKEKGKHKLKNSEADKKQKENQNSKESPADALQSNKYSNIDETSNLQIKGKVSGSILKKSTFDPDRHRREMSVDSVIITPNVVSEEDNIMKKPESKKNTTKRTSLDTSTIQPRLANVYSDSENSSEEESVQKPALPAVSYYRLGESMANSVDRKRMKVKKSIDMSQRLSLPLLRPSISDKEFPQPQDNLETNNSVATFEDLLTPLSPPLKTAGKAKKSVSFSEGGNMLSSDKSYAPNSSKSVVSPKAGAVSSKVAENMGSPKTTPSKSRQSKSPDKPSATSTAVKNLSELDENNKSETDFSSNSFALPDLSGILKLLDSPDASSKSRNRKNVPQSPSKGETSGMKNEGFKLIKEMEMLASPASKLPSKLSAQKETPVKSPKLSSPSLKSRSPSKTAAEKEMLVESLKLSKEILSNLAASDSETLRKNISPEKKPTPVAQTHTIKDAKSKSKSKKKKKEKKEKSDAKKEKGKQKKDSNEGIKTGDSKHVHKKDKKKKKNSKLDALTSELLNKLLKEKNVST